jgi:hypothetical protein
MLQAQQEHTVFFKKRVGDKVLFDRARKPQHVQDLLNDGWGITTEKEFKRFQKNKR